MRANGEQEGNKNTIELRPLTPGIEDEACDDPLAIKLMVDFFYHLDYIAPTLPAWSVTKKVPQESPSSTTETAVEVDDPWADLTAGKKSKKKKKKHAVDDNVTVHARVFAAAVKYQVPSLQALAAFKFATAARLSWDHPNFAKAARIVYTTTPEEFRELRDIVVQTIHGHETLFGKALIEQTIRGTDALSWELCRLGRGLPAVAGEEVEEEYSCDRCGGTPYLLECEDCGTDYMGCCHVNCQSCGWQPPSLSTQDEQ